MDMSTNESLGDPASILASIASIAEDLAEQQPVSTESREVVNDVNRQAQIEQLVDSVGSVQQQIQTHDQQSQLAGTQRSSEQQPIQQQLLMMPQSMQQQQMPQDIQSIQQQPLQQQQSTQQQQLQQPGLQSQSQQGFWPPQQQQFTMPTYGGQPQLGIGQQPQWSPFDVQARQLDDLSALMHSVSQDIASSTQGQLQGESNYIQTLPKQHTTPAARRRRWRV